MTSQALLATDRDLTALLGGDADAAAGSPAAAAHGSAMRSGSAEEQKAAPATAPIFAAAFVCSNAPSVDATASPADEGTPVKKGGREGRGVRVTDLLSTLEAVESAAGIHLFAGLDRRLVTELCADPGRYLAGGVSADTHARINAGRFQSPILFFSHTPRSRRCAHERTRLEDAWKLRGQLRRCPDEPRCALLWRRAEEQGLHGLDGGPAELREVLHARLGELGLEDHVEGRAKGRHSESQRPPPAV